MVSLDRQSLTEEKRQTIWLAINTLFTVLTGIATVLLALRGD